MTGPAVRVAGGGAAPSMDATVECHSRGGSGVRGCRSSSGSDVLVHFAT